MKTESLAHFKTVSTSSLYSLAVSYLSIRWSLLTFTWVHVQNVITDRVKVKVIKGGSPKYYRLVYDAAEKSEVLFRVEGYIIQKNLPPIERSQRSYVLIEVTI